MPVGWAPPYRRARRRYRRLAWERDRGRCAECGTQDEHLDGAWEADHIKPCVDGGDPLDPANIQTLCLPCHHAKTAGENQDRATQELVRLIDWLDLWADPT